MSDMYNDDNKYSYRNVYYNDDMVRSKAPNPKMAAPPAKKRRKASKAVYAVLLVLCCLLSGVVGSVLTIHTVGSPISAENTQEPSASVYEAPEEQQQAQKQESVAVQSVSANTGENLSVSEISSMVGPAVVSINIEATVSDRFGRSATSSGSGSGIIITADGYILTNNHVIDGASNISVKTSTGNELPAKLIGADSATDLAVLKIEASNLPYVTLGDSDSLGVGDLAIAIGNPLGELSGTVTTGIISATDRIINVDDKEMNLLQTDAAINPGNSGGALCNGNGEVIGVVTAKTSALGVEGLGFAIPINDAKPVIEQLISNGYVTGRPALGLSTQDVTSDDARFYRLNPGVYVVDVTMGGAADEAGVKSGDMIVSLAGQSIEASTDIKGIKEMYAVGDSIEIVLDRNGEIITLTITLGEEK